jgi:fructooligosaccharide transport system substrate-binding protein
MKKLSQTVVSAIVVGGLLAGCSSQSDSGSAASTSSSSVPSQTDTAGKKEEKVKLTFWRNSGNDTENAAYDKLVASFMQKYPNISVEMTPIPYSDYDTKLRVSIASGSPPDIMALDAPTVGSYATILIQLYSVHPLRLYASFREGTVLCTGPFG